MMSEKIERNFQSKKNSIQCKFTNFSVLFWLSNVMPYSLYKNMSVISLEKSFDSKCFILKSCVTRFNGAT